MIYSCILYTPTCREPQLTRLRMLEESFSVDRWLICASRRTLTGQELPETKPSDFGQYANRCEVLLAEHPQFHDTWENERRQRDLPMASKEFADDDVLIAHDADEIHRRQDLPRIIAAARERGAVGIDQHFHYYRLNYVCDGGAWSFPFAATGQHLREHGLSIDDVRRHGKGRRGAVATNGHHFSYLMSPSEIVWKLKNFSHQEYNQQPYIDEHYVADRIARGEELFGRQAGAVWTREDLSGKYPLGILDNRNEWREWIA